MSRCSLVSFFVICYNQEDYILDAIESVLAQTYEPLEIIISDDCSTDSTFERIEKRISSYQGPHKIIINRNEVNKGITGNINRGFELANGEFFVMGAGDDISVPERTELLVHRWQDKIAPVDLVCSFFEEIDKSGKSTGFVKKDVMFVPDKRFPVREWVCGATGACAGYSRKLYEKYGPLDPNVIAEDWVYSFRAWVESGLACIESPLVKHRTHDGSISVQHRNVKQNKSKEMRRKIMEKSIMDKHARVKEWLKAWLITGGMIDDQIGIQFKQWIKQLELESLSYKANRLQALKSTLLSLVYGGDFKTSARLFVRHVLRIY